MRLTSTPSCVLGILVCFLPWKDACAQLRGQFSLEKEQYEVGEPIYLEFDLTNVGRDSIQMFRGDRYSFCGGYKIELSSGPPIVHSSCDRGFDGSCVGGEQIIAPGETRREKVLVNFGHDLSKSATYDLHATYATRYGPRTKDVSLWAGAETLTVETHFQIQLTKGSQENLMAAFQPFVAALASKDEERQREAARVIGSLAPPFLEDTIVSMLDSPAARPFALLGLRNLNTPRSREILAGIVGNTPGYTYEREQAIKYLAEMEDKKYLPLLLDVAEKQLPNEARDYVLAAAQLGGDDAMSFLGSLLDDPNPFSRANGVMALSQTGSRRAVPLLIETLKSADTDLGKLASIGLIQLTHRSPFSDGRMYSDSPAQLYVPWLRWWSFRGNNAPTYGPRDCSEIRSLN